MNFDLSNKHVIQLHVTPNFRLPIEKITVMRAAIYTLTSRMPDIYLGKHPDRNIQHFTGYCIDDANHETPIHMVTGNGLLPVKYVYDISLIIDKSVASTHADVVILAQSGRSIEVDKHYKLERANRLGHGADFVRFVYDTGHADVRLGS